MYIEKIVARDRGYSSSTLSRVVYVGIFILAASLIGRAAAYQNNSSLDFQQYIHGTADMPYQGRYLMVPILRWVADSPAMQKLGSLMRHSARGPEELFVQFTNVVCLLGLGLLCLRIREDIRPRPLFFWLAPSLLLWITACTYVIRDEQNLYYPYDFLSALFFTIGIVACLEYRSLLLLIVIAIGSYNRETVVFLLPLWLACNFDKSKSKTWITIFAGIVACVIPRMEIRHWLHNAPSGLIIPVRINLLMLIPHHWPQVMSVGGFLLPILWINRSLVSDSLLRRVWIGILPFMLANLVLGWWNETRIFGEMNVIFAVTAAVQFEQFLVQRMNAQSC